MNIQELKRDIFDPDHPEKQIKAAYMMRYYPGDTEVVHILFGACYEAKDAKLQQEAVRSLGVLKLEEAREAFVKSTHNFRFNEKRMRACYHLGTLGDPKGIDALLKRLHDPDERVRRAAVISCGRIGQDQSVINALQKLVNGFEPDSVQAAAKLSIDHIKRRIHNNHIPTEKKSFNKPRGNGSKTHNAFNKSNKSNKVPKTYTPRGF